jgi:hypothetical protein
MSKDVGVRTGQVWEPIAGVVQPLKVKAVSEGVAQCQVIGRDRTMSIAAKRLVSGAAGYRLREPKTDAAC